MEQAASGVGAVGELAPLAAEFWRFARVTQTWTVTIPGEPRTKARPRLVRKRVYNPSRSDEDALRWHYRAAFRIGPLRGSCALLCVFYRGSMRTADTDNLVKLVKDAGNTILWQDDRQVRCELSVLELDRENPRTLVVFGERRA